MTDLSFRPACEADLDRLLDLHASAFPDPRGHAERRTNFCANPLGSLGDLWVALRGDVIQAHAFLLPLRGWFGGVSLPVAGVATVGVAPEARGTGVAAALLTHLHGRADASGAAILTLFAFRQGFYARHGYVATSPTRRLALHPASIPVEWKNAGGVAVRGANRSDREAIVAAYTRAAARGHGWMDRPTALWDRRFANERRVWMIASRGERVTGYVSWALAQAESHTLTRLVVRDLAADDDASRRALLAMVGAQRDQVAEVELEIDARDPLDRALVDLDRGRFGTEAVEHPLGTLVGGPMVRLVDVARGLTARRYASSGAVDMVIDGLAIRLTVPPDANGQGVVTAPGTLTGPLAIGRAPLAAVLYGGLSVADAARLGWAQGDDATLARADALFASPPFFTLDAY
ncbi:MAG TPA: GNAT family N-acetyltransferase [Polyangiaceae bacterium]